MAHSFVRGNWANAAASSPIIMQKSCHDMDILVWLTGSKATRLSSIGRLNYFKEENAPQGSTARCRDCPVEGSCRFSAYKAYLPVRGGWPATAVCPGQTEADLRAALGDGPYGRCVFRCGNDVSDSQTTLIEFESGAVASFTLSAFTNRMNRSIRILCENGEIYGDDGLRRIEVRHFASNQADGYAERVIHTAQPQSGHGGGDVGIVEDFFALLDGATGESRSSIAQSVESHIMSCAAEESRLQNGAMVDMEKMRGML
jgi:predicted dehydrogenase